VAKKEKHSVIVVGISGSLRKKSYTRRVVEIALEGAKQPGVKTQLIDLAKYELAFCDGNQNEETYPKDVFRLRKEVGAAQGIILGTPEYHGGYSGVLKNALDLMGFDEFEGKMIGLVGVAGGAMGAINAMNSLREVGRALHSWVVPQQAAIPMVGKEFDEKGNLKNDKLKARVMEVGKQVARFASLHNSKHAMEFLQIWESAAENPGGENV